MPPSQISVRQLTSAYALRYSNTRPEAHGGFSKGMLRDVASWESPEGYCWNAVDMLCDIGGKIRKRGGYTSPSSSNRLGVVENILGFKSSGVDGLTGLWGSIGKTGAVVVMIDPTTGAATSFALQGTARTFACRPFQHANFVVCSFQALSTTTNDVNRTYFVGGSAAAGTGSTNAGTVAGSNVITGLSGVTAGMVGGAFQLWDSGNSYYAGRVVAYISASSVRVEPRPSVPLTATNNWQISTVHDPHSGGLSILNLNAISGRYGLSYQGRIVLGYTLRNVVGSPLSVGLDVKPYRVAWTSLEEDPSPFLAPIVPDGSSFLFASAFVGSLDTPYYNYLDFPELGAPGITGLAAAGEGTLLVFGKQKTFRISGPLSTETVLNPTPTYTRSQISENVGCIEAKSIQYTRRGVIFAGLDNLYSYDGSSMKSLLTGTNENYYQARLRAGDVIYGSAYAVNQNHYYLSMSGTDGGLMFNLDGNEMTRMSNLTLFDSTPDPTDATALWGVGWWDTTAAAPTFTKGQLTRLDPIWLPTAANKNDGNGTAVLPVFESKSYPEGDSNTKKRFTRVKFGYDFRSAAGTPTVTLQADTQLNTSDAAYVSIGTLSPSTTPQVTGFQTLPLLKKGQAIEVKLALSAACDTFELTEINVESQSLRPGRS